jgi:Tfp pilus assembly protein FimT
MREPSVNLNVRGATLVELALTVALVGILAGVSLPRVATAVDRASVRGAAQDVVLALAAARAAATRRGDYVSFVADPRAGRVRVVSGAETLFERDVARLRGVRLDASRESVTFAPTGLGWGAANTTIVVSRGDLSDTITTSRLGRVRHN